MVVLHNDSSFVTLFFFFLCCFGTFACPAVAMVITRAMIRKVDVRNRVRLRDYFSICGGYKVIEW